MVSLRGGSHYESASPYSDITAIEGETISLDVVCRLPSGLSDGTDGYGSSFTTA